MSQLFGQWVSWLVGGWVEVVSHWVSCPRVARGCPSSFCLIRISWFCLKKFILHINFLNPQAITSSCQCLERLAVFVGDLFLGYG